MQQEQWRHATSAALTIYSENQFECNTNAINKLSLWHSHSHTHARMSVSRLSICHTHMHTHLQHALCVCASCAVFNFLWPTASITINITQTRHALCPPPSACLSLSSLCSFSPLPLCCALLSIANEKCHPNWYWCKWKMSTIFARGQRKQTRNSSNMNMNTNSNMSATLNKKGREKESERDKEWERQRTIADVVNFELVQLQFLQPRLTFVCSSLNEPEIEVASSNKSAKYSPEHKKQAAAAKIK